MTGRPVLPVQRTIVSGHDVTALDLSGLATGTYVLRVLQSGHLHQRTIMKQ